MKVKYYKELGIPKGPALKAAQLVAAKAQRDGLKQKDVRSLLKAVVDDPNQYLEDPLLGELADKFITVRIARESYEGRGEPAPYKQWGVDLEPEAVKQMQNACELPVSERGALMPDAHLGYGLPIGGVLATHNAVIPYAVGMDIACRMKMTVLDIPPEDIEDKKDRLIRAIEHETRFGVGASFKNRRQHAVMDKDWSVSPVTHKLKDKAWSQLGTSGSGNHFVEFGLLTFEKADLGLEAGTYLALLSHSGSRGTGGQVATHYSRLAMNIRQELPRHLLHLAWFDLDSHEGQEYWRAMQLMGEYAAANHRLIHTHIASHLGVDVLLDVENHHNFAWKERHFGKDVVVHRKGATPAGKGDLGVIPGSMATSGFIVRGLGNTDSLNSASHGAGRRMSRKEAKKKYRWKDADYILKQKRITLLSAGLDEVPMAYKDIEFVMAQQADLVEIVARFNPRLVKMAGGGERPED